MCGRYRNQQSDPEEFGHRYGAWGPSIADALGQIEVRPTDQIPIVRATDDGRVAETVRWGFQPPNAKRPLINARSDKLFSSGLWSKSMTKPGSRVLIPADAWYEWLSAEDPKVKKQPFIHLVDGGAPFSLAGLYGYAIVNGELVDAATIITMDAAGPPAEIHDRMPVVLADEEAEDAWLRGHADADLVDALFVPLAPGRVTAEPVTL